MSRLYGSSGTVDIGLDWEIVTAIAEVDGVKEVDGAHSYDAFVMNGNEKWTLRFLSEPGFSE